MSDLFSFDVVRQPILSALGSNITMELEEGAFIRPTIEYASFSFSV